jgi:predicted MPP superfamily phosphohydrolase
MTDRSSSGAAASEEPLFTWVHLSDIHLRHGSTGHQQDQGMVLAKLTEDLGRAPALFRKVDAVFVTGDIAFSGGVRNGDEYAEAHKFLDNVRKALNLDWHRIFVVPGNHDVQRETGADTAVRRLLIENLRTGTSIDGALANAEMHGLLEARFENYRRFASMCGGGCGDLWWTRLLTGRRGLPIRLIGLNSALLSLDDSDHGKLQLGLKQLSAIDPTAREREFIIVLTHHPLEWLVGEDRARGWLRLSAHLHLCGHMHEAQTWRIQSGAGSELVQIMAGATHAEEQFSTTGAPPRLQDLLPTTGQGYNFGALMLGEEGQVQVWVRPRAFSPRNKRFQADVDGTPDGGELGVHNTSFVPKLEPEPLLRSREDPPRTGPWVFTTENVSAVCETLDDTSASRMHSVQEFLDFMARSFENLFQLESHSLDVHPLFKNVRERLKAMTPGVSLNESDGVLMRAQVRHVILRTRTLLELMRKIDAADLAQCGRHIGQGAAEDLIQHTLVRGPAIPANPEAFVALWDYWDRTGGWGKLSLDSSAGEGSSEESRTRTWRLRISRNFLTLEDDPRETHRLSVFWCGYIHGFLSKALPAIENELAQPRLSGFSQQITFPAYNQVVEVRHLEDSLFEIQFQEHRFSSALAALAGSMKRLHAHDYEAATLSAWRALMLAKQIVTEAKFNEFLATATDEERDTIRMMEEAVVRQPAVNETIARRWFGIVNRLIRKLAYPEGAGLHDADATHPLVH